MRIGCSPLSRCPTIGRAILPVLLLASGQTVCRAAAFAAPLRSMSAGAMSQPATVRSPGATLAARVWKPSPEASQPEDAPAVILVHQWSILGGQAALMHGIAKEIVSRGHVAVTFDMRGVGESSGRRTFNGREEIQDVEAVCEWAHDLLQKDLVLLGSSAGAPIAGSAIDSFPFIKAYVGIGYTFGFLSSLIFGFHYEKVYASEKPKLFIMGTKDEFTSADQLTKACAKMKGVVKQKLFKGIGHFALEGPSYDALMAQLTTDFIKTGVLA